MVREKMARAMIEPLINKTLNDMHKDPERSLRNIIDLLLSHPDGRFSNDLFKIAQKMLADEGSAYYKLVKKIMCEVDIQNFKEFSMNIGYNACTVGAKKIRSNTENYILPWLLFINYEADSNFAYSLDDVITEGKQLGIYAYAMFGKNVFSKELADLYKKHSDCAFIIFTPASFDDEILNLYDGINNILVSVNANDANAVNAVKALKDHKRFYAAHILYSNEDAQMIFNKERLKAFEKLTTSFVFCSPTNSCSMQTLEYVKSNSRKIRDNQKYSYVMMDTFDDSLIINKMISGYSTLVAILKNGDVVYSDGNNSTINDAPSYSGLKEILKK